MEISFLEPPAGATVPTPSVTLYGTTDGRALSAVSVNGRAGEVLAPGFFSAIVPLEEGSNTLTAVVTDLDGLKAQANLQLTRRLVTGEAPFDSRVTGGCEAVLHATRSSWVS